MVYVSFMLATWGVMCGFNPSSTEGQYSPYEKRINAVTGCGNIFSHQVRAIQMWTGYYVSCYKVLQVVTIVRLHVRCETAVPATNNL